MCQSTKAHLPADLRTYIMGAFKFVCISPVSRETPDLTHISLASLLWDIGKQNNPRCDAAERGVPSGTILVA